MSEQNEHFSKTSTINAFGIECSLCVKIGSEDYLLNFEPGIESIEHCYELFDVACQKVAPQVQAMLSQFLHSYEEAYRQEELNRHRKTLEKSIKNK